MTYKRGNTWYASWMDPPGSRRRRSKACPSREAAERLERRMREQAWAIANGLISAADVHRRRVGRTAIARAAEQWRDALREAGRSERHVRSSYTNALLAAKLIDITQVGDITDQNLARLRTRLVAEGKRERTIRAYTWSLTGLRDFVLAPPAQRGLDSDRRSRALTVAEVCRLMRGCTERRHAAYMLIASLTGWRPSEAVRIIERSVIDFEDGTIEIPDGVTKNGRGGLMPLSRITCRLLVAHGSPAVPEARTWRRILDRGGVEYQDDRGRFADRKCLRNTFGTWLAAASVDDDVIRMLMRHGGFGGARLTVGVYRDDKHLVERLREGIEQLERWLRCQLLQRACSAPAARDSSLGVTRRQTDGRRSA